MSQRKVSCPRPNFSSRKSLRLLPLLFILTSVLSASFPNVPASARQPNLAQSSPQQETTTPDTQEVITLAPGQPLERELAGGQRHVYQIALTKGQYIRIDIKQQRISLVEWPRPGAQVPSLNGWL